MGIDFGVQWVMWGISSLLRTERFYDLTGSSTFLLIALKAYFDYSGKNVRAKIQTSAVVIWAVRLGFYLFSRVLKDGHDRRFTKAKEDPSLFLVYWTIQGVWILVTLLPSLMMIMEKSQGKVTIQEYLGWTMWTVGFLIEVIADYQKDQFRRDPANKDKFISTGLWSLSRHPNYAGEIFLWFGLFVSASSSFTSWWQHLSILSPTFVYLLITKVSGIPLLEQYGLKKWGNMPDYQAYINQTPELFPSLMQLINWK